MREKNERIKGNKMVFAVFSINFVFGPAFKKILSIPKNELLSKRAN